jgi:hypothetical protein
LATISKAAEQMAGISQSAFTFQRVEAFCSPSFETASVLVRLDHVACFIAGFTPSTCEAAYYKRPGRVEACFK